jgi:hypothetical protein
MVAITNRPQIMRFEVVTDNGSSFVICELGTTKIRKQVENLQKLVRFSAILSEAGELMDVEVIVEKE